MADLLTKGADCNARGVTGGGFAACVVSPALIAAVSHAAFRIGCPDYPQAREAVHLLLAAPGIQVDALDGNGWTALMMASVDGNLDLVRMLLRAGARRDIRDTAGETALDKARKQYAHMNRRIKADLLLALLRGLNRSEDDDQLFVAAHHGDETLVAELLKEGADCNARGIYSPRT